MKTFIFASLYFSIVSVPAQTVAVPADTDYAIKERGANHRVWQRTTYEQGPNGMMVPHVRSYTELAAGLNYKDANGQWVASKELIEAFSGGAVARQGQHQVIFANNLNSTGAIDMQTPDGKRLRSNILGLMYYDPVTGDAVMIGRLQDSEGELIADNRVLYPNAFDGVNADVQYTYKRDSFEQDVILREQPPAPEIFGLDSRTTELEVFTEFIDPPSASVVDTDSNESGLEPDQEIKWGATSLGRSRAFNLGSQEPAAEVSKRYITIQGRHFLLEKVLLRDIKAPLLKLPEQAANQRQLPVLAFNKILLPKAPLPRTDTKPIRLATITRPDKGYVLDYVTLNSAYTNFTFQGDSTYYLSGNLNLSGTNYFEGGTVIKYAANASITAVTGSKVIFQSAPYCPVIFTSKDDNAVGEAVSGATGTPSGYYASPALNLGAVGSHTLSEFRVAYARKALVAPAATLTVYDAQLVNCELGISDINGTVNLGNVLFSNTKTNFNATANTNTISAQNVTFNNAFAVINGNYTNSYLALTNCIFVNATNLAGNISAGNNGFYNSPMVGTATVTNTFYPLKTAGAASCYLTNGCAFLDVGTSNLDANTFKLIQSKTTYPPIIYSNITFSAVSNFSLQTQRDTNTPDFGYHYDPIDYCFGGVRTSSNVVFSAGIAVAWFELPGSGGPGYGLGIYKGVNVAFKGTAMQPCFWARYSSVQEGINGKWKDKGWLGGIANIDGYAEVNIPSITARFTFLRKPAGDSNHFRDGQSGQPILFQGTSCEILNGFGGYNLQLALTNCLLDRANIGQGTSSTYPFEIYANCTFHGGSITINHWEGGAPYWYSRIFNCAFEGTTFAIDDPFGVNTVYADYNYNAFLQGAAQPPTEGANTLLITNSFNRQKSWFGNFYLPTNSPLIDAGNTSANLLTLYHYTTQTNQIKEASSIVDIGYHYVATDGNGNPIDTDGDGTADYLEDVNGNGVFDAGDLGNWLIGAFNGLSTGFGLQVFTPLK